MDKLQPGDTFTMQPTDDPESRTVYRVSAPPKPTKNVYPTEQAAFEAVARGEIETGETFHVDPSRD